MRKLFVVLLLAAGLCTPVIAQKNVVLAWKPPASGAWTNCSSTVTVVCSDYLIAYDATVSPAVALNQPGSLAPSATTYSTPVPTGNAYSTRLYNLVLFYKDMNGTEQQDAAATCGATNTAPPCAVTNIPVVPPPTPTNVTGTVQ